jgi:DNA invertase Pin-like site-specific DNA recombinase
LLDHLREGDTLLVWKFDRHSRSLEDVLHIMERIADAGLRSLTDTDVLERIVSGRAKATELHTLLP